MTQDDLVAEPLPNAETFRAWLVAALPMLGVKPARIARDLEIGKNTLNRFVAEGGRDISLSLAHRVSDYIISAAREKDIDLQPYAGFFDA